MHSPECCHYFFYVNDGKLEESSRTTCRFAVFACNVIITLRTKQVVELIIHPLWVTGWSFWANQVDNSVNMEENFVNMGKKHCHFYTTKGTSSPILRRSEEERVKLK